MFAEALVVGEVVGGCEFPVTVAEKETEVACVVVVIVGIVVEDHSPELLFYCLGRLGKVTCQLQQAMVVHLRRCYGLVEQSAGGGHVEAVALLVDVETSRGEIFAFHQPELRHDNPRLLCQFVVVVFLPSNIHGIKGVAELDKPMSIGVIVEAFGTYTPRVPAASEQHLRTAVGTL